MFYSKGLIFLVSTAFPVASSRLVQFMRPPVELSAFFMTVVAIGTGIMIFQGEAGCFYINVPPSLGGASPDYNPAENYRFLPIGCKISNGLSVTVLISALFTFYAVMLRYDIVAGTDANLAPPVNVRKNKNNAVLLWWGNEAKEGIELTCTQVQKADSASKAEYHSSVVL